MQCENVSLYLNLFAKVLNQTQDHRQRVLHNVAKELLNWSIMVRKMKAIYHTMNLFNMDVSKKCLIGECWVPIADLATVQNCLAEGSVSERIYKKIQLNLQRAKYGLYFFIYSKNKKI